MAVTAQQAERYLGLPEKGRVEAFDARAPKDPPKDRIETLVATATALVSKYAPDAPESVSDEAILQVVSYVHDGPGPKDRRVVTHNAMLHSGAAAMLSPWKVRRAGPLGESGT